MMDPTPSFETPALEYFCKAYFNQDWDLWGPNARAVLDLFASQDHHRVAEVRDAAADLLSRELSDDELARELDAAGLEYAPDFEGMTHREWLTLVVERLSDHLARA